MIDFSHDPKVTSSLLHWRERRLLPTGLGSAELRGMASEISLRSIFSARTTNAAYLQEVADVLDDMLAGKINKATGRLRLMRKLAELGYDPAKGFPGEVEALPPAERGSLQDLGSEQRLNLLLETNLALARNYGRSLAGNKPVARITYPAWELTRLELRETPRGTPESHTAGWPRRWNDAGESVLWDGAIPTTQNGGRMMALKQSPLWQALADGVGGYTDTLGHPFPPFAFGSGMDWLAVPRAEWDLVSAGKVRPPAPEQLSQPEKAVAGLAPTPAEIERAARLKLLRAAALRSLQEGRL